MRTATLGLFLVLGPYSHAEPTRPRHEGACIPAGCLVPAVPLAQLRAPARSPDGRFQAVWRTREGDPPVLIVQGVGRGSEGSDAHALPWIEEARCVWAPGFGHRLIVSGSIRWDFRHAQTPRSSGIGHEGAAFLGWWQEGRTWTRIPPAISAEHWYRLEGVTCDGRAVAYSTPRGPFTKKEVRKWWRLPK